MSMIHHALSNNLFFPYTRIRKRYTDTSVEHAVGETVEIDLVNNRAIRFMIRRVVWKIYMHAHIYICILT